MDFYKANIQYDGSLDKLKLIIVVRGDPHNKGLIGDTWSQTSSMRALKYFLIDAVNKNSRVHQLDFIGSFLQEKLRIGYLSSWKVDMQAIFQNIQVILD